MRVVTESLTKSFEGIKALDAVSVDFEPSMVTAIIGPNGAGKTTLFNVISGFLKPNSGHVFLIDDSLATGAISNPQTSEITGLKANQVSKFGLGVLFQDIRVFNGLSVIENLLAAAPMQSGENPARACFQPRKIEREDRELLRKAMTILEYVGLSEHSHHYADELSYGQQKLAAIARLLMSESRVLLLDEPTSGVSPAMIPKLLELIQSLAEKDGCTVIMIEHNLNVVRDVGDWVYLMSRGAVEVFGIPEEVLQQDALVAAFPNL